MSSSVTTAATRTEELNPGKVLGYVNTLYIGDNYGRITTLGPLCGSCNTRNNHHDALEEAPTDKKEFPTMTLLGGHQTRARNFHNASDRYRARSNSYLRSPECHQNHNS